MDNFPCYVKLPGRKLYSSSQAAQKPNKSTPAMLRMGVFSCFACQKLCALNTEDMGDLGQNKV